MEDRSDFETPFWVCAWPYRGRNCPSPPCLVLASCGWQGCRISTDRQHSISVLTKQKIQHILYNHTRYIFGHLHCAVSIISAKSLTQNHNRCLVASSLGSSAGRAWFPPFEFRQRRNQHPSLPLREQDTKFPKDLCRLENHLLGLRHLLQLPVQQHLQHPPPTWTNLPLCDLRSAKLLDNSLPTRCLSCMIQATRVAIPVSISTTASISRGRRQIYRRIKAASFALGKLSRKKWVQVSKWFMRRICVTSHPAHLQTMSLSSWSIRVHLSLKGM